MTVRKATHIRFEGLNSDSKPTYANLEAGAEFFELDTRRMYIYDGAGTWYRNTRYYGGTRTGITITTTSSNLFSGTSFTAYGERLSQYAVETTAAGGAPTRTLVIYSGGTSSFPIFVSTAINDSAVAIRTLPTSEGAILDGAYQIRWTLSANSQTTGITDYYTLYLDRGWDR